MELSDKTDIRYKRTINIQAIYKDEQLVLIIWYPKDDILA